MRVGGSGVWTGVYKYDSDSLLVEGIDARGVKTTVTYDGLHRINTVSYTGETGYQTPTVTYTYDETESGFFNNNRLTKVQTAANATYGTPETIQNYRYDKVGQVVKHTQSIGNQSYQLEYGYNLAGQLTSEKYPSGRVVEMDVDDFGRLSTVSDAEREYVTGLTFNAQGVLSQLNLGNGTHETFSYNDRFQMTSQSLMKSTNVLQKYDYSYGQTDVATGTVDATKNNGQLGKIESFIGSNKQASQRFAYDHLGRLKEAREHRGDNDSLTYKQVFDFDRFGNLYRKASSNPTTGQANPLPFTPIEDADISKSTNRFTTGTTYDDAGQVIADNKFRDIGFAYDANGRQVKATKTNQPDAWTVYDALGNRVATKINDVWQYVVYDAFGKLVAEYGIAAESTGGVKYIQQDWQGSVRAVTNSNGFIVARTDHQAFGEEVGIGTGLRSVEQGYSADKAARQGYGLTESDAATGQQHTGWRKLETQAGRWSSPDPYNGSMLLGDPQSFNRYAYVGNDPTNFVDPSGLIMLIEQPDWSALWSLYFGSFDRWRPMPIEIPGGETPGGGSQDPPGTPCSTGGLRDGSGNPLIDGIIGEDGRCHSGPTASVDVGGSNCGVNPVTGKPGFTANPKGKPGNLRPGVGGQGHFGARRISDRVNGHRGLDISGRKNVSTVVANRGGKVVFAGAKGINGNLVSIDHGDGTRTAYAHLYSRSVNVGNEVIEGQPIGILGETGNASGQPKDGSEAHVHFQVTVKGTRVDPAKYLNSACP